MYDVERQQRTTRRPYEPQVAALFSKGDTYLYDDAKAGTIYVGHFGEIQQELVHTAVNQIFKRASQQLALTIADGCSSPKIQYVDVTRFADGDLKCHGTLLPG